MLVLSLSRCGQMEFWREDANDGVGDIVQDKRLADGRSVAAEMGFEECIG